MKTYKIQQPGLDHWYDISELVALSIPNAIISSMGVRSGSLYYSRFLKSEEGCCFIALDDQNKIAGAIIGTVDCDSTKKLSFADKIKLLAFAHFRLFKSRFLSWLIKGISHKLDRKKEILQDFPNAELIAIAIDPDFRGSCLAYELISNMENAMKSNGAVFSYAILTEKHNKRANKFYSKIGAQLMQSYMYHGKEMNYWLKKLS